MLHMPGLMFGGIDFPYFLDPEPVSLRIDAVAQFEFLEQDFRQANRGNLRPTPSAARAIRRRA